LVPGAQIQDALKQAPKGAVKDAVLRVVSVADEYNVGISVVQRSRVNGKALPDALQHHAITEVYQVTQGCGVLVTGGTLVGAKEMPPNNSDVISQLGPTAEGTGIDGGASQQIGPGDVVIVPPDTPHGFSDICSEGVTYVLVRVDNHRVLKPR
jgi:mannose-6-phosphate isomerase-like protein (cupin superfamily)